MYQETFLITIPINNTVGSTSRLENEIGESLFGVTFDQQLARQIRSPEFGSRS